MAATQTTLRFDEHEEEYRQVWARMSAAERTQVARRYARLLVKAAKVDPLDPKRQREDPS